MHQWELKTPTIPQGLNPVRTVRARVTYDYNTSGYLQMSAVSEDEFQRMTTLGTVPPVPFTQNSAGPIQMAVPTADSPYIVIDTTGGEDTYVFPFKFVFTNAGTGFPVTEEEDGFIGGGGRLSGTITLMGPGVEFDDCLGITSGTEIDLDDTEILPRVRSDNTANVACTIKFDIDEWGDRPTDTVTFVFNLFYTYYESAETSVSIVGR